MSNIYIIQFDGDLPTMREWCRHPYAFNTLDQALNFLLVKFGIDDFLKSDDPDAEMNPTWWFPDPEDDRILIWEAQPSAQESMQVVWHFSGWHWPQGADYGQGITVPAILDQGTLPGCDRSLYSMAQD